MGSGEKHAYRSDNDSSESEARRICEQQLVDKADVLAVKTHDEINELGKYYDVDPQKIVVVTPGVNAELFTPHNSHNTEIARRGWADALERVLDDDSLRHTMAEAAVERAQQFC